MTAAEQRDYRDTQRARFIDYLNGLGDQSYVGKTAAKHFLDLRDFFSQDQLDRFVLEGAVDHLAKILRTIRWPAKTPDRKEIDTAPREHVVRMANEEEDQDQSGEQAVAGRTIEHAYEVLPKLTVDDWENSIMAACKPATHYADKVNALRRDAKAALGSKQFGVLEKKLRKHQEFQLMLEWGHIEEV